MRGCDTRGVQRRTWGRTGGTLRISLSHLLVQVIASIGQADIRHPTAINWGGRVSAGTSRITGIAWPHACTDGGLIAASSVHVRQMRA